MQDRVFYIVCAGFILGVLVRSFVFVNIFAVALLAFLALLLFVFFLFISKNKYGVLISIFVFVFSLGIMRFHIKEINVPVFFDSKVEERVSMIGEVTDEPVFTEKNQRAVVEIKDTRFKSKVKILVSTNKETDIAYGDEVSVSGVLERPTNFDTDQGKEFDYINYLRKDGIFYIVRNPEIEIISRDNGNLIKSFLFSAKGKFLSKINMAISEPESLLAGGLVLGDRSAFNEDLRKDLVDTGTIHIVALSGYNVTIIAEWIMKLFAFLPQSLAIGVGVISILLFVVMTGASSTALRAGVMAVLALFARATGRTYDVARALILAGIIMISINPFILRYDASFQLSFLATTAVIFFAPRIEKYFMWVTKKFGLRDIFSVTTAVYIFVLPFILYKMGNLSFVALPANIFILPFIPITMFFGFLTGLVGMFSYFISIPFGYVSYLLLHYELSTVRFFADMPFASIAIPDFPLILTIAIYAYFAYMFFGKKLRSEKRIIVPDQNSSQQPPNLN